MKRFVFLFFFSVLSFLLSKSQELNIQLESYVMQDGLSSNMLYTITEDKQGFIWIGTANGLDRFDGSVFKNMYKEDSVFVPGVHLNNHVIKALLTDQSGNIWVGTQGGGLNRIDYKTQKIHYYQYDPGDMSSLAYDEVLSLLEGPEGNIWVGTEKGLSVLDIKSQKFHNYYPDKKDSTALYTSSILSMFKDEAGGIWLTSWGGIVLKVKGTNPDLNDLEFERFPHKNLATNYPSDDAIWGIHVDRKGRIWAGTFGQGVIVRNPQDPNNKWHRFSPEKRKKIGSKVFDIHEDDKGRIWLATGEGVNIIEMPNLSSGDLTEEVKQAKIHWLRYLPGIDNGLPADQGRDLFFDHNGVIWIAFEGGLGKYDASISKFNSYLYARAGEVPIGVGAISKDDAGYVWVGTYENGLIRIDEKTQEKRSFTHNPTDPQTILGGKIRAMLKRGNELWIGTDEGLSVMNLTTYKINNHRLKKQGKDKITAIYDFEMDAEGNVFAASYNGLIKINGEDFSYRFYPPYSRDGTYAIDNLINDIAIDEEGKLWLGTEKVGLLHCEFSTNGNIKYQAYVIDPNDPISLRNKNYVSVAVDNEQVYIGSTQGLQILDRKTGEFSLLGMKEGLPTLNVEGIHIDEQGFVWVGTNPGIARLNQEIGHFTIFNRKHGLKSTNYYDGALFVADNGEIYYGGNNGYVRFHPKDIRLNYAPPQVHLSGLKLGNQEVGIMEEDDILGDEILQFPLNQTEAITLSYKHNIITLDFSLINFLFSDNEELGYRMLGLEEHWNYGKFIRSATYTYLAPGEYTFQVIAASHEGVWSKKPKELKITVLPPFWHTWYFRIIAFVVISVLTYLIYQYRLRRVNAHNRKLKQKVLERTQELAMASEREMQARMVAEEANRSKSDFLANMSHEIRTPMNGVLGMAELLDDESLRPEQKDYVKTIRKSGENLLSIINDILDFAKIESGKLELDIMPFNLRDLVEEVLSLFGGKVSNLPVELLYDFDKEVPIEVKGDSLRLRQVLINLIGNAIKFTEEGEILLKVERRDTGGSEPGQMCDIKFSVKDYGIGIPEEKLNSLFEAFTQVDASTSRKYGGTGLGLAISAELIKLMGGQMEVKSTIGEGTNFFFTLPVELVKAEKKEEDSKRLREILSGKKVLLVEDNDTHREILERRLAAWGIETCSTSDANTACEILDKRKGLDLIFTDLYLPGMDGKEFAEYLKSKGISLPVILFAAFAVTRDMQQTGLFKTVLTKPLTQKGLLDAMEHVFNPQKQAVQIVGEAPTSIKSGPDKKDLRILLAEDNPVNQKLALKMLERLGYTAQVANNGLEAIKCLEESPFDLVLMDVQMPELDGLSATRRIRSEFSAEQQIPIIAMTANAMKGDREKCLKAGMNDYISKPFKMADLEEMLDRYNSKKDPQSTQAKIRE